MQMESSSVHHTHQRAATIYNNGELTIVHGADDARHVLVVVYSWSLWSPSLPSWRASKRWIGSTATANIHETFKKRSYSPQLQHFLIIRQFGGNSFIWKINGGKRALDVTNNFETEIFRGNINRSEEEDSSNHTGFHRWKPYKCDFTVHRQYVYRGI